MKTAATIIFRRRNGKKAFFLLEAVIGMALLGLVMMAMYTGLCTTTFSVQLSRENLRATQIMTETLDTIRLYGWKKINPIYIQTVPTLPLYVDDPSKAGNDASTRVFTREITLEPAPIAEPYGVDMQVVTVKLTWQTGKLKRTRTMSTMVSKYGLNRYVY
ncbi:MAG TPA: hypothetical protein VJ063_20395 [Verrucomicrobiae bacterium]|nr:hypothetical protein [Verrucomicrobiae bacterium]